MGMVSPRDFWIHGLAMCTNGIEPGRHRIALPHRGLGSHRRNFGGLVGDLVESNDGEIFPKARGAPQRGYPEFETISNPDISSLRKRACNLYQDFPG